MVLGHSLDHVTRQWNVIEKRIDSCQGGKLCQIPCMFSLESPFIIIKYMASPSLSLSYHSRK